MFVCYFVITYVPGVQQVISFCGVIACCLALGPELFPFQYSVFYGTKSVIKIV